MNQKEKYELEQLITEIKEDQKLLDHKINAVNKYFLKLKQEEVKKNVQKSLV